MSVVLFPGFLSTTEDGAPVARAGALDLRTVSLPSLVATSDRTHAVERARGLIAHGDIVVGYSLGARIAMAALADDRTRTRARGLVLLSATRGIGDAQARAERAHLEASWGETLRVLPHAFVDTWRDQPIFRSLRDTPAGRAQHARRAALASDPVTGRTWGRGWAEVLSLFGQGASVVEERTLAALTLPTVIVAGSLDVPYVARAAELVTAIPGARAHVVERAGHALLLEAPEAVASIILELSHRADESAHHQVFADARGTTGGTSP